MFIFKLIVKTNEFIQLKNNPLYIFKRDAAKQVLYIRPKLNIEMSRPNRIKVEHHVLRFAQNRLMFLKNIRPNRTSAEPNTKNGSQIFA